MPPKLAAAAAKSSASSVSGGKGRNFWLLKSEPHVFSIDQMKANGVEPWEGIRNYLARNYLRDGMKVGDLCIFYHSSCKPPGAVGVVAVNSEAYADPTQFETGSKYYDAKSSKVDPRWWLVDVKFVEKFEEMVPLALLKSAPDLEGMLLWKRPRLSVVPVTEKEFQSILKYAGATMAV
jgi:predicted RNA-binding protein with PUA-like domain